MTKGHTVKRVALPKGWEGFMERGVGHPGEGWLGIEEIIASSGMQRTACVRRLTALRYEVVERLYLGRVTKFYRPPQK